MHAFRAFLERQMAARRWEQRDLVQRSGLSRQQVSRLLNDDRDAMLALPKSATMEGLARAFGVPLSVVVLEAARACGVPVDVTEVAVASPAALTDEDLVEEVRRRLTGSGGRAGSTAGRRRAGPQWGSLVDEAARED